jgi:protein-S-isoprenylcysteine O-methyltransferase Ste14
MAERAQVDAVSWLARRRVALGLVTSIAALLLARPTWPSWLAGFVVACAGEAIRVWAAGHLEKSREVTTSGPYRWMRHPLYVGSSVLAAGVVIASRSWVLAVLAAIYMGSTITAAIRSEEAYLRGAFGDSYDRYAQAAGPLGERRFSMERALRNKEYRAVSGVVAGFGLLALRILIPL